MPAGAACRQPHAASLFSKPLGMTCKQIFETKIRNMVGAVRRLLVLWATNTLFATTPTDRRFASTMALWRPFVYSITALTLLTLPLARSIWPGLGERPGARQNDVAERLATNAWHQGEQAERALIHSEAGQGVPAILFSPMKMKPADFPSEWASTCSSQTRAASARLECKRA